MLQPFGLFFENKGNFFFDHEEKIFSHKALVHYFLETLSGIFYYADMMQGIPKKYEDKLQKAFAVNTPWNSIDNFIRELEAKVQIEIAYEYKNVYNTFVNFYKSLLGIEPNSTIEDLIGLAAVRLSGDGYLKIQDIISKDRQFSRLIRILKHFSAKGGLGNISNIQLSDDDYETVANAAYELYKANEPIYIEDYILLDYILGILNEQFIKKYFDSYVKEKTKLIQEQIRKSQEKIKKMQRAAAEGVDVAEIERREQMLKKYDEQLKKNIIKNIASIPKQLGYKPTGLLKLLLRGGDFAFNDLFLKRQAIKKGKLDELKKIQERRRMWGLEEGGGRYGGYMPEEDRLLFGDRGRSAAERSQLLDKIAKELTGDEDMTFDKLPPDLQAQARILAQIEMHLQKQKKNLVGGHNVLGGAQSGSVLRREALNIKGLGSGTVMSTVPTGTRGATLSRASAGSLLGAKGAAQQQAQQQMQSVQSQVQNIQQQVHVVQQQVQKIQAKAAQAQMQNNAIQNASLKAQQVSSNNIVKQLSNIATFLNQIANVIANWFQQKAVPPAGVQTPQAGAPMPGGAVPPQQPTPPQQPMVFQRAKMQAPSPQAMAQPQKPQQPQQPQQPAQAQAAQQALQQAQAIMAQPPGPRGKAQVQRGRRPMMGVGLRRKQQAQAGPAALQPAGQQPQQQIQAALQPQNQAAQAQLVPKKAKKALIKPATRKRPLLKKARGGRAKLRRKAQQKVTTALGKKLGGKLAGRALTKLIPGINVLSTLYDLASLAFQGAVLYKMAKPDVTMAKPQRNVMEELDMETQRKVREAYLSKMLGSQEALQEMASQKGVTTLAAITQLSGERGRSQLLPYITGAYGAQTVSEVGAAQAKKQLIQMKYGATTATPQVTAPQTSTFPEQRITEEREKRTAEQIRLELEREKYKMRQEMQQYVRETYSYVRAVGDANKTAVGLVSTGQLTSAAAQSSAHSNRNFFETP